MWAKRIFLSVAVASLVNLGTSLECYTCSSQLGVPDLRNDCESFWLSNDERHKISQCMYTDAVCAKYVVDHSGLRWVHRSCQHHDICSVLSARYSNDMNMLLECETCADRNMCNSASLHLISMFSVAVLFLVGKCIV